jgi:hypothetical protein
MAQRKNESIRSKDDLGIGVMPSALPARMLPAMPIRILHRPSPVEVSYRRTERDVIFRIRYDKSERFVLLTLSAFDSRDAFLRISKPSEALDFLSITGFFRYDNFVKGNLCETLAWSEFRRWQELVTILVRKGFIEGKSIPISPRGAAMDWDLPEHLKGLISSMNEMESGFFYRFPEGLVIKSQPDVPNPGSRPALFAEIHVRSTLQAILATNYVDSLSGVNYGLCARPSCNKTFEVTSKHEREYCSQACAHKASVARRREKEVKTRNAANASAAGIKAKKGRK